ncbi:uncharacterized protein LOC119578407 [Penaeus monodon]|uniref:uncharacterized protein LOC119578407 n=1 Tax=Penaeus monodon TaxID=6687 RepID=UPI0018A77AB3|nr:uncharacterized protein LOC119578407 [Penaeus monodon]
MSLLALVVVAVALAAGLPSTVEGGKEAPMMDNMHAMPSGLVVQVQQKVNTDDCCEEKENMNDVDEMREEKNKDDMHEREETHGTQTHTTTTHRPHYNVHYVSPSK